MLGTFTLYNEFSKSSMDGRIDLNSDTLKFALVSVVGDKTDPVPCWGAGGSTNLSTDEVSGGTSYVAGGKSLSSVIWTQTGGVATLDAADLSGASKWAQDGSGPTNIKTGILYSDDATNKDAVGFMDLTGDGGTTPISLQDGDVVIAWHENGIFTHTVNPT